MSKPGAVGTMLFPGAMGAKWRPIVVVSNATYNSQHPDVIVGVVTSNIRIADTDTDYVLLDWQQAGLRMPSAFRAYLLTTHPSKINIVGHLTDRDWKGVLNAVQHAFS